MKNMNSIAQSVPPHAWFGVSAIFHYLGPSFAVLLFPAIGVLGVAWFRIATATLVFAPITRPWRTIRNADNQTRLLLLGLGICLATMNVSFYLALERLPMSLVAAMEFLGVITIAFFGMRSRRNVFALLLTIIGVFILIELKFSTDPWGMFWSALNTLLFSAYIILGHKAAEDGAGDGVERLGAAMLIAFILIAPIGLVEAIDAFGTFNLVLAGIGVGICSSVIPYVCDQFAMSRLPRASFALLLALLPASATIIAAIVLAQIPSVTDLLGIALVIAGIAVHEPKKADVAA
ncbi:MAG: EamA family transporter [Hyphomicrobiales bacterium]|nr:MAG: EamA family transporter [Hyphomicrobiales bacterium]